MKPSKLWFAGSALVLIAATVIAAGAQTSRQPERRPARPRIRHGSRKTRCTPTSSIVSRPLMAWEDAERLDRSWRWTTG